MVTGDPSFALGQASCVGLIVPNGVPQSIQILTLFITVLSLLRAGPVTNATQFSHPRKKRGLRKKASDQLGNLNRTAWTPRRYAPSV